MLTNPSFEGEYIQHSGTVLVAPGWSPFWWEKDPPHEIGQGPCMKPEFKAAPGAVDPRRVLEGSKAQCWFAFYKVMDAGLYQVVAVEPHQFYRFSVYAQAWCSNSDDPAVSNGELYASVGIDPNGGQDPFELGVLWTGWQWVSGTYKRIDSPIAAVTGDRLTVFIRAWNKWRLKHNDIYVDAADLEIVELGVEPEPEPEPEPGATVDYQRIREIVRQELQGRDPVLWPKV